MWREGGKAPVRFQSHAGSIEASVSTRVVPDRPTGFNPTLVRLRLADNSDEGLEGIRFQSHAGSIEARRSASRRSNSA